MATKDGLAVVTEQTLIEFLRKHDISSPGNDSVIRERMKRENPQIYRMLVLGLEGIDTDHHLSEDVRRFAHSYYESGMQIVYELLRMQTGSRKP